MNHSINRREFLTRSGAVLTLAAAGGHSLADTEPKAAQATGESWGDLPVRALLLSVPHPADVTLFCQFIREVFPREGVNTLVLRFEYQYKFQRHPELADIDALS